jgi:hypothetical protein
MVRLDWPPGQGVSEGSSETYGTAIEGADGALAEPLAAHVRHAGPPVTFDRGLSDGTDVPGLRCHPPPGLRRHHLLAGPTPHPTPVGGRPAGRPTPTRPSVAPRIVRGRQEAPQTATYTAERPPPRRPTHPRSGGTMRGAARRPDWRCLPPPRGLATTTLVRSPRRGGLSPGGSEWGDPDTFAIPAERSGGGQTG